MVVGPHPLDLSSLLLVVDTGGPVGHPLPTTRYPMDRLGSPHSLRRTRPLVSPESDVLMVPVPRAPTPVRTLSTSGTNVRTWLIKGILLYMSSYMYVLTELPKPPEDLEVFG